jgi:tRNA isopentenyl-2-thiomethyl-A-37 hydroxylase MiaE
LKAGQNRDLAELKALIAEQELEKKERENQVARKAVVPMEEVTASAQRATAIWTLALRAKLETESPARLVGKDMAELRAEIRTIFDELCEEVAKTFDSE